MIQTRNVINTNPYYLITANNPILPIDFLKQLQQCLDQGIRLIQLRAKQLNDDDYLKLAEQALLLCEKYQAILLLNSSSEIINKIAAPGVHLTSQQLMSYQTRPFPAKKYIAASCHNKQELQHAANLKLDWVTLSPVNPSIRYPAKIPLGWENFSKLITVIDIPIYALGGMKASDLTQAKNCGAVGIAGISAWWE